MKGYELKDKFPRKKRTVADLARFLGNRAQEHPNYCFLLGAGASVTSGVRSAGELVEEWRKDIYLPLSESTIYESEIAKTWLTNNESSWYIPENEYACLFERKYDLQSQRRNFVEQEVDGASPSIGYAYLTNLVKSNHLNTIFTTNFDDLLNEAFFRFTDIRPYVCAHDSSVKGITITSKRPKIIKLHGDYLYEDLKCTTESTAVLTENMSDKLRQFLREYGLIVAGYSGCDKSVMNILVDLVSKDGFLQNGIYWCLRHNDDISDKLIELLDNESVFYVITNGFDELTAELNEFCYQGEISVVHTDLLARSMKITNNWLESKTLNSSPSKIIKNHIEEIRKHKKNSYFASALTKLVGENKESDSQSKLSDEETVTIIELNSLISRCKFDQAISKINEKLPITNKHHFKKQLLLYSYRAYSGSGDKIKAVGICDELIKIDPDNPTHYIRKLKVTPTVEAKLILADQAISKDEYSWVGYYEKAQTKEQAIDFGVISKMGDKLKEIEDCYEISVLRKPHIRNQSWKAYFKFLLEHDIPSKQEKLLSIIQKLQSQDKFSPEVCELIYLYCEKHNSTTINESTDKEIEIFSYLNEAIQKFYPKKCNDFWGIIVDASLEFNNHAFAKSKKNLFSDDDFEGNPSDYYIAMANYYLEISKDIDRSKEYLQKKILYCEEPELLSYYLNILLYKNEITLARNEFEKYNHILSFEHKKNIEADLLIAEGKCNLAVQKIESLADDPYFDHKYSSKISYAHLTSGNYQKTYEYCNAVITRNGFTKDLYTVRINYEFAKRKLNKKPNKSKLDEIINTSLEKDVVAVGHLLIGNTKTCIEMLLEQINKRHSRIYSYSNWPALQEVKSELFTKAAFKPPIVDLASSESS